MVLMGSGVETARETVDYLNRRRREGRRARVRLYRPFSVEDFVAPCPRPPRIAVLDRTKEPGAIGEPLYLDVVNRRCTRLREGLAPGLERQPTIIGGRYGLSSKEFTPAMVKAVFDELAKDRPKNHFTVGIVDDVLDTSLPYDRSRHRAGRRGAGGVLRPGGRRHGRAPTRTRSRSSARRRTTTPRGTSSTTRRSRRDDRLAPALRPAADPLRVPDPLGELRRLPPVSVPGEDGDSGVWPGPAACSCSTPRTGRTRSGTSCRARCRSRSSASGSSSIAIDALKVARDTGMGGRINTIMQTCFFAVSGVLPRDEAIAQIKKSIEKTYSKKGEEVVRRNFAAVDHTLAHLFEVHVPAAATSRFHKHR